MDLAAAHACSDRLVAAFVAIAADVETPRITPALRAAWRAAVAERDGARDPESRLVAQATLENLERVQSPRRLVIRDLPYSRLEIATALRDCVAGQGQAGEFPSELDLDPILTRYNGPLGGEWRLEHGAGGRWIVRRAALGEDELICMVPRLANALFLVNVHDDVAALLAEVLRLRGQLGGHPAEIEQ